MKINKIDIPPTGNMYDVNMYPHSGIFKATKGTMIAAMYVNSLAGVVILIDTWKDFEKQTGANVKTEQDQIGMVSETFALKLVAILNSGETSKDI